MYFSCHKKRSIKIKINIVFFFFKYKREKNKILYSKCRMCERVIYGSQVKYLFNIYERIYNLLHRFSEQICVKNSTHRMRPDASLWCLFAYCSWPLAGDSSSCRSHHRCHRRDWKSKDNSRGTDTEPCRLRIRRTSRHKHSRFSRRALK